MPGGFDGRPDIPAEGGRGFITILSSWVYVKRRDDRKEQRNDCTIQRGWIFRRITII